MENTRTLSTQMDCWSPGAAPAQTTLDEALWVARGRYAAFGVSWEIQTDDVSAYHLLLDRLPPGSTAASSKVTARSYSFRTLPPSVSETEASYLLEADGRPLVRSSDPDEIAEAFEEDVKWLVAGRSPRRVFLRAGVVGWRDRVIVIPGGPRSGKSTLVRALVGCGATYFSDEYAVLEGHTVGPYPSRVVNWSAPRVSLGAWVDDGTAPRSPKPLPVGVVLFAPFQAGAVFKPKMVSRGKFLLGMFKHAVAAQSRPEQVLRALEAVSRKCNALESVRGDAQAVATYLLERLV